MTPAKLIITTPTDVEIVMTRTFEAPCKRVYDAMTAPDRIMRWCSGPPGWSMVQCDNDLRVGGTFRHAWRSDDGTEMAMHGVYRELLPSERIVRSEMFDFGCDAQAGEQLATLTLAEHGGQTTMTVRLRFPSKSARDATLASGMERGAAASYDNLADLLAQTTAAASAQGVPR